MHYLWGPTMNLSIILSLYSYRKYANILHGLLSFTISIFTLVISLSILRYYGWPKSSSKLSPHFIIGFTAMMAIMVTIVFSLSMKLLIILKGSSRWILRMRVMHKICGYLTVLIAKANYYYIFNWFKMDNYFWGFIAMDATTTILIIIRKIFFPKLEQYPPATILPTSNRYSNHLTIDTLRSHH